MALETKETLLPKLKTIADRFSLDYRLADAIISVESSWYPLAVRFEPSLRASTLPEKFAKINRTTVATEKNLQCSSFGLVQILGGTARFLQYTGPLPGLFDPDTNLYWGCKYLSYLHTQYTYEDDIIASYNAGSPRKNSKGEYINQEYVDKVYSFYRKMKR